MNTSAHSTTEEGDIKIIVGDRIFTCHKEVLANASDYFASMFSGNYKEKDEDSIVLHLDPTAFEEARNGIYEGQINITPQNACKLLQVCQYLKLSNFEKSCVSFIEKNLNVDDLLQALNYAFLFKNTSFFNTIVKHIAENFKQISNREDFSELEFSIFESILSHEKLNRNDDAVMLTIAKWVKKNSYQNPTITEKILLAAKPNVVSFPTLIKLFSDVGGINMKQEVSTKGLKVVNMPTEKKLTIYCKAKAHFNVFISLCLNRTSEMVNKWTLRDKFQTSFQNLKTIVIAKRQYFLTYDRNSSAINTCCQFWMVENGEWKFLREPPFITDNYQLAKCGELIFLLLSAAEEKIATNGRSVFGPSDCILYYYDCDTQKWYSTPKMLNEVDGAVLVSDSTSILYVIGGLIAPEFKKTVTWIQTFDVKNSTWDKIYSKLESSLDSSYCEYGPKSLNILYASACHYANNLYISYVDENKEFKIINYDIKLQKFFTCSKKYSRDENVFVSKNKKHELIMYKSKLYAIDNGPISTVDKYQLTNNRWIKETPIPKKITNNGAEAILTSDLTAAAVVADYYD